MRVGTYGRRRNYTGFRIDPLKIHGRVRIWRLYEARSVRFPLHVSTPVIARIVEHKRQAFLPLKPIIRAEPPRPVLVHQRILTQHHERHHEGEVCWEIKVHVFWRVDRAHASLYRRRLEAHSE
jgi:hypothetical protein